MADSKSHQPDGSGQQIECFVGDIHLDLSGWTLIPYRKKPALSLVPAKADQIAGLYTKLTGKEMSEEGRSRLNSSPDSA